MLAVAIDQLEGQPFGRHFDTCQVVAKLNQMVFEVEYPLVIGVADLIRKSPACSPTYDHASLIRFTWPQPLDDWSLTRMLHRRLLNKPGIIYREPQDIGVGCRPFRKFGRAGEFEANGFPSHIPTVPRNIGYRDTQCCVGRSCLGQSLHLAER